MRVEVQGALLKASSVGHVCTCGDCDLGAFLDRCKYEAAIRALDELLRPTAIVEEAYPKARAIIEGVLNDAEQD